MIRPITHMLVLIALYASAPTDAAAGDDDDFKVSIGRTEQGGFVFNVEEGAEIGIKEEGKDYQSLDKHTQYKDETSFTVGGQSDKFYPVVFPLPDDGQMHKLVIYRKYFETAPKNDANWGNSKTHFGQLYLEIDSMHSSWGGAEEVVHIQRHTNRYSQPFGKAVLSDPTGYFIIVHLRGGGAIYHASADMPINSDKAYWCKPLYTDTKYFDHAQDTYDRTVGPLAIASAQMPKEYNPTENFQSITEAIASTATCTRLNEALQARVETLENGYKPLMARIQALESAAATLTTEVNEGLTVAQFKTDFPEKNGFKYMYNTGTVVEPAKYGALTKRTSTEGTIQFTVGGRKLPDDDWGYLNLYKDGGHPLGANLATTKKSHFAIVEWTVPEKGLYSLTKTAASGPSYAANNGADGVEIKVFVVKSTLALSQLKTSDMVLVIDNSIKFGKSSGWVGNTHASFDTMLGVLPVGARVFVCIGPGPAGIDHSDSFYFDFAFSKGAAAALTPGGNGLVGNGPGIPLFGGGTFTTTSIMWTGIAKPGVFNSILVGTRGNSPRLATGTYFFTTSTFDTFNNGGVLYAMQYASGIFLWTNVATNSVVEDVVETHGLGHAANTEVLSFATKETPHLVSGAVSDTLAELGFRAKVGWSTTLNIRFDFVRLH